ncbi:ATP-dependent Clp protease proteolytic subunit-related protein 4, chloroplastic [Artemisia annua]|uniref:ATP-dependent Clp protease proteolytic subunit n=1 Tax=Artemisia annua TaxID=35608 RepID=A0A2U1L0L8_ARTAN|nr:ATP-dependent Clp protease proteolytic subunit-related protein 4, chloroplastic [Artemisia annua]
MKALQDQSKAGVIPVLTNQEILNRIVPSNNRANMSGRGRKLPGGGSTSRRSVNPTFGADVMTRDQITQLLRQEQQEKELYKKQAEEAQQRAYLAALKADAAAERAEAAHSSIGNFQSLLGTGGVTSDFSGQKIRPVSLNPNSRKRVGVTMVIPFSRGSAWEQPPPDLASYLYKERIGGEKLGYETEAFAIYDVMRYVKPPIFTLCVGNAWGEAALLLAAGAKGNRSALPSSTIMIKQPIARFQGQASDVEIMRKEIKNVKTELVNLYAKHINKTKEQIEEDIRRPKYFSPSEAVEYGIIDKVIYNERGREDRGVLSDLKRAQLL